MPPFPLALVTGAAHRLGKCFAKSLARQGYAILLHYHSANEATLARAVEEMEAFGVPVFPLRADLTRPAEISALWARADALLADHPNLAPLSVLVNSAAVMPRADARTLSVADFDNTYALNLRAPFALAQAAFQRMSAGGLVVNITDVGARKAWTGFPAYVVTKAGLESLTAVLARAFAPTVRVNAIAPGLVLPSDDTAPEDWQRLVQRVPAQRPAEVEEIISAFEFLLANPYVTGQTITVDGGYSLL